MAFRIFATITARAVLAASALLVAALLVWVQSQGPAQAESARRTLVGPAQFIRVIDGETIEDLRSLTVYRLDNADAARGGARVACLAERRMSERTAAAASALVARARRLDVLPTGRFDRSGHPTAFVIADGRDLGETLVARGFARPKRTDDRPWCDSSGDLIL